MKVRLTHWRGGALPLGLIEGDQEITPEQIVAIYNEGHNVHLDHSVEVGTILWVDTKGKKFTMGH